MSKLSKFIVLTSTQNNFRTTLDSALHLNEKYEYELCLVSIDLFYCVPNIISKKNNIFRFSLDGGFSWKEIEIPTGCYTITKLNNELARIMKANNYPLDVSKGFEFNAIKSRVRTIVLIKNSMMQIDFSRSNSFGKVLGFNSIIKDTYNESQETINLLPINTIFVKTNLTESSIYNIPNCRLFIAFFLMFYLEKK